MDAPLDMGLREVPLRALEPGPNPRKHKKSYLKELAASIAAVGLLQPLGIESIDEGRRGRVRFGNGRLEAITRILKWKPDTPIPVVLLPEGADEAMVKAAALTENRMRAPMSPMEECDSFCAMVDDGKTAETVASWFAVTPAFVRQRLQLRRLIPEFRAVVDAGELPLDLAGRLAFQNEDRQRQVWERGEKRGYKLGAKSSYGDHGFPRHLVDEVTREAIDPKHALFDVEAEGFVLERDLFDDKGDGKIGAADVDRFLARQAEIIMARAPIDAKDRGCVDWKFCDCREPEGFDPWSAGWRWVNTTSKNKPRADEGYELVLEVRMHGDGRVGAEVKQRPIGGVVPPPKPQGQGKSSEEKIGQALQGAIYEVQALIAAGQLLADHNLGTRLAILALVKSGRPNYAAHLGSIIYGHDSPAAAAVVEAFAELAKMGGATLSTADRKSYAADARQLHNHIKGAAFADAVMKVDAERLPALLTAALVLHMDPLGTMVQLVRQHAMEPEGKFYRMGEYELQKLSADQLAAQAKKAKLKDVAGKTRKATIANILAKGRAAHDVGHEAPILPLLAKARDRTYRADW